jgi:3-deoxy-7-phosphoheptulonate synthase
VSVRSSPDADPQPASTVVVAGTAIGAGQPVRVVAGPCSVESLEQFRNAARAAKQAGAVLLRGGAFKPRTSPYSFQGLGPRGLAIMREVADEVSMGIVTEALAADDVPLVAAWSDMIQIGARSMDNLFLLDEVADSGRPVLLKRGFAATVDEVLAAAERIVDRGNDQVVICERGSKTFEPAVRNSLDIAAIPEIKRRTGFPVVADPSHGSGRWDLVTPVSLAAVAAGADGLIVEIHPDPSAALSDGAQSLRTDRFGAFMVAVARMAAAVGRPI